MSAEGFAPHSTFEGSSSTAPASTSSTAPQGSLQESAINISTAACTRPLTSSDASAAVNTIQNHPVTQNIKETVTNGPMAESVKDQSEKTTNELSGLANARTTPSYTAANGQDLTHYHSFFYSLLSWEHPRATGIAFASAILFIFACRYLPILRWTFKVTWITLGITALAEVAGKFVMGTGVASSFRPRKYYKIPKEALESSLDDLEQLVNFFVIEFQRILFAENPVATIGAFITALLSYYLIKIVPIWGMTLLSTCVLFLGPLIYTQNKELIDGHIENAHGVISAQAAQVKDLAGQHASTGFETMKAYTGAGAAKAQELVGSARQQMPSSVTQKSQPATTSGSDLKQSSFPSAPKTETFPSAPKSELSQNDSPAVNLNGNPIAAP